VHVNVPDDPHPTTICPSWMQLQLEPPLLTLQSILYACPSVHFHSHRQTPGPAMQVPGLHVGPDGQHSPSLPHFSSGAHADGSPQHGCVVHGLAPFAQM
jgi:hypothetical protein